jgi:hypothetical protein
LYLTGITLRHSNPPPRGKLPSYSRKLLYMSYELLSTGPWPPSSHKHRQDTYRYVKHKIIYFLCFLQSLAVERAVYACPWYQHFQAMRDVKFVIMRAQKPVRLTAGIFYTVSLETFLQVEWSFLARAIPSTANGITNCSDSQSSSLP